MAKLNKRHRRWLALALLGAVVLLFVFSVIVPIAGVSRENRESIEELEFRLRRYLKIIRSKEELLDRAEEVRAQIAEEGYFSMRETAALASADMQKMIKEIVAKAGGQLTSTQVVPVQEGEEFPRIAIKVRISGTIDVLREVLYEVESARPLLIVENLNIQPIRGVRNRLTRQLEPSDQLNVTLDMAGFMRAAKR